jgi:hypothetical protein
LIKINFVEIESFLEGRDPQKYIIAIESNYSENYVDLVINDPETGKRLERHNYKPFVWLKQDVSNILYGGNKTRLREARAKFSIRLKSLRVSDESGFIPDRMENGYKFMAETSKV